MTVFELLKNYSIYTRLTESFPDMVEFSKTVEIIPWSDEFSKNDRNPEIIDTIEYLNTLLRGSVITEDEYRKLLNKTVTAPASKTLGVAFIEEKKVSFRKEIPEPSVLLHELGHVYYSVSDLFWDGSWGGGELLMWFQLNDAYTVKDENIKRYHKLLRQTFEQPSTVHEFIKNRIASKINVYPHLFTICLFEGYIPNKDLIKNPELFADLNSTAWESVAVDSNDIFAFFQNVIAGLSVREPFSINYARWLGLIE